MFQLAQLRDKASPQPRVLKTSLQNVSTVLVLLVTLAACNQLGVENDSELDIADLTPGELIFTSAPGNINEPQELTLRNDDAAPVEITGVGVTGSDASSFALASTPQFPVVIAPHQQMALKVRFTPRAERDAFQAALRITSDKPESNAVEVNMYGEVSQGAGGSLAAGDEGWAPLFNGKNLDDWYTWLPSTGKNNDPKGVFNRNVAKLRNSVIDEYPRC